MYKKILIPTDGSAISTAAAHAGVEFARHDGIEIVGIFVAPEYQYPVNMEIIQPTYPTEEEYETAMQKIGDGYFAEIKNGAEAAGLKFTGITVFSSKTANKIVQTAEDTDCDLIFIGSHGRGGWGQMLLGSVTTKILSTCQIPVLVYRLKKASARAH